MLGTGRVGCCNLAVDLVAGGKAYPAGGQRSERSHPVVGDRDERAEPVWFRRPRISGLSSQLPPTRVAARRFGQGCVRTAERLALDRSEHCHKLVRRAGKEASQRVVPDFVVCI